MTTSKQPAEDITKLPQWAQRKIRKLKNELQSRTAELETLTTGEGSIYYGHYAHDASKRRAIPEHETIRFVLDAEKPDKKWIEIHRNVHGDVIVSANHRLLIHPIAGNCASVSDE